MLAVLVLRLFTVLATGVRQNERVVGRLLEATTVALVPWKMVLSIAEVAIWTGPAVECKQSLGSLLSLCSHLLFISFSIVGLIVTLMSKRLLLLFLFVLLYVLL